VIADAVMCGILTSSEIDVLLPDELFDAVAFPPWAVLVLVIGPTEAFPPVAFALLFALLVDFALLVEFALEVAVACWHWNV
jgi:hypothetical protein